MKPVHLPRLLRLLFILALTVTFLVGTLRAFDTARAATVSKLTTPISDNGQILAVIGKGQLAAATQTPEPSPPSQVEPSADTTGIIALASLIVVIIIVGASLGQSRPRTRKKTEKG